MNYYEEKYRKEQEALEAFTNIHASEIVEIENNIEFLPGYDGYEDEYGYEPAYPDLNLGEKRSEITGNLKEMVLKRVGIDTSLGTTDHTVEIIESHENGGYCNTCAFEYIVFTIFVDDVEVYRESFSDNPFGMLQNWLTEESDE